MSVEDYVESRQGISNSMPSVVVIYLPLLVLLSMIERPCFQIAAGYPKEEIHQSKSRMYPTCLKYAVFAGIIFLQDECHVL